MWSLVQDALDTEGRYRGRDHSQVEQCDRGVECGPLHQSVHTQQRLLLRSVVAVGREGEPHRLQELRRRRGTTARCCRVAHGGHSVAIPQHKSRSASSCFLYYLPLDTRVLPRGVAKGKVSVLDYTFKCPRWHLCLPEGNLYPLLFLAPPLLS